MGRDLAAVRLQAADAVRTMAQSRTFAPEIRAALAGMTKAFRTSIETKEKEIGVARTIIESCGHVYGTTAHPGTSDIAAKAAVQVQKVLFRERLLQKALVDLEGVLSRSAGRAGSDAAGERAIHAVTALATILDAETDKLHRIRQTIEAMLRPR